MADIGLEHPWVVYRGSKAYRIDEGLSGVPVEDATEFATDLSA